MYKEAIKILEESKEKKIAALSITEEEALHFTFEDGSKIRVFDDGQSCCEHRYMRTDDVLENFVGATLVEIELRNVPNENSPDDYDEHEIQFLLVTTSKGVFTVANHNVHNGYYGGFVLNVVRE
jgi:hypothetical protein